jgi:adenylyltransferase/sulfurtransferase
MASSEHGNLTDRERERYDRQIILPGWGEEAQQRIKDATLFIAGAGGLGSAVIYYLAAAGAGSMRLCDDGEVELSNLNRQILHGEGDIGRKKVLSAREGVERINSEVRAEVLDARIDEGSVEGLVAGSDLIVDCLDNFETRYVLNRFAVQKGLPMVHAGVYGMSGQITFLHSPNTPCLRCIFPEAPPPEKFPVVGATAAVIGSLEALEVLKYLSGTGVLLKNRLLVWEGDIMRFEEIAVQVSPGCPECGLPDEIPEDTGGGGGPGSV